MSVSLSLCPPPLSLCIFFRLCLSMCMHVYVYEYMNACKPGVNFRGRTPQSYPPCSLTQFWGLLVRLSGGEIRESTCVYLPRMGCVQAHHRIQLFLWIRGLTWGPYARRKSTLLTQPSLPLSLCRASSLICSLATFQSLDSTCH